MNTTAADLAPLSDEELVERARQKDAAAFELLMRRSNQRLYRLARSIIPDNQEAEDIVQETYLRAFMHLWRFEGRSSVATWLTRIALHESLRRRRRAQRAMAAVRAMALDRTRWTRAEIEEPSMSDRLATSVELTEALDTLPTAQRAVVVLRLVQGLDTRETAACLRLSEANVKVLLHRGKLALAASLGTASLEALTDQYAFGAERCDRMVQTVLGRMAGMDQAATWRAGADGAVLGRADVDAGGLCRAKSLQPAQRGKGAVADPMP